MQLIFAGAGRDADSLIERLMDDLERRKRTKGVVVVSNDRRVQAAAVGVHVKPLDARSFLANLLTDAKTAERRRRNASGDRPAFGHREEGLDADSARAWLREFGVDADGVPTRTDPDAPGVRGVGGPAGVPQVPGAASVDDSRDQIDLDDLDNLGDLDMGKWLNEEPPHR